MDENLIGATVTLKSGKTGKVLGMYYKVYVNRRTINVHPDIIKDVVVESKSRIEKEKELIVLLEKESGLSYKYINENKRTRKRELVEFRHLHIYYRLKIMNYSGSEAGSIYGKDHSSVFTAAKKLTQWVNYDRIFRDKYRDTISYIKSQKNDAFIEEM